LKALVEYNGNTEKVDVIWDTGATVTCISMQKNTDYVAELKFKDAIGQPHGKGKRKHK